MYAHTYVYIYIERERERERDHVKGFMQVEGAGPRAETPTTCLQRSAAQGKGLSSSCSGVSTAVISGAAGLFLVLRPRGLFIASLLCAGIFR